MNFQEAERRFWALENARREGRVSSEFYQQQLVALRVSDSNGAVWQMQAETGQWKVFWNGQWQSATPPQPQPRPAAYTLPPQQSAKKAGSSGMLILIASIVGICLACVLFTGGGYLIYQGGYLDNTPIKGILQPNAIAGDGGKTPSVPTEMPEVKVSLLEVTSVTADGAKHTDANGVSITVPPAALSEAGLVELTAQELNTPWVTQIQKTLSLDTPFYSVAVSGSQDSTGRMSLTFPAPSSDSRLYAVIDGNFLVQIDVLPQNGELALDVRAGAAVPDPDSPFTGEGDASITYITMTPRQSSNASPVMVSSNRIDDRHCLPDKVRDYALNICRKSPTGSVMVTLPLNKNALIPQADIMIDHIEATMARYVKLGFTTAGISKSRPIYVVVFSGNGDPMYKPQNGVLYIPEDVVAGVAGDDRFTVFHEMAHWIQDEEYAMIPAYYSHPRHWWLEVSAEIMVMLLEDSYIETNMTTYGKISHTGSTLVHQSAPYQWPAEFYVQAQLLRLNICDSPACPLTEASFAKAISEGEYALMDSAAQAKVSGNIDDYARYLLGKVPEKANTAIPLLNSVRTGTGYGDVVDVTRTHNTDLNFNTDAGAPQVNKAKKDGKPILEINAKIEKDGVYPLTINSAEEKYAGMPVEIVVQPGAPFYYTTDNGELQYSDGTKEVKIGPAHTSLGFGIVRFAAMGKEGEKVFKATIQPVDLTGTWFIQPTTLISNNAKCVSADGASTDGNPEMLGVVFSTMLGTMGELKPTASGGYEWAFVSRRAPPDTSGDEFTYNVTVNMENGTVEYKSSMNIPKPPPTSSLPAPVGLSVVLICLPVAWSARKKGGRIEVILAVMLLLALGGCFGLTIYGGTDVTVLYDKMEYLGGEETATINYSKAPTTKPLWKMEGKATYNVNTTIEVSTEDEKGNEGINYNTCTGTITYATTTYIYKDVVIDFESGIEDDD